MNDPVNASDFTWTYRADGQPSAFAQPNGNTTALAYDALGRLVSKDTGSLALYDWTYNRAGQVLTESSTITSDPSNGTVTYAYDPLERLTSATLAGATTAYGWDKVPNRTSVQVGAGTPATTTYDAADRPTTGANPTATYGSDEDGRLTAAPGNQYSWDRLGRLTQVRNGGGTTLATYSYDPLDRLRLADDGAGNRVRLRYVGLTTAVAQWLDDATGTVTRSVANGWTGERLADWTGAGADLRVYGTNAHHDTTWLATSTGSVSQALRYDPWGNPRPLTVPTGYTPFRFQGSWHDATTDLSWVVTRWYAPALGRFISEDTLLGTPADPPSRHLYAYAAGEPIGRWDPDGRDDLPTPAPAPAPDICQKQVSACATMTSEQRKIARLIAQAEWERFWRYAGVVCFDTTDWVRSGNPDYPWPYEREFCWGLPTGAGLRYVTQGGRTLVDPSTWSKVISFVKGSGWKVRPRPAWLLAEMRVAQAIGVPRNAGHVRMYFGPTRYRVPDFDPRVTIPLRGAVVEVKLTTELKWTSQLRDFVNHATARGAKLEIFTDAKHLPPSSSQFWVFYNSGAIILRRVP